MYRFFLLALPLLVVACRSPAILEELPLTPLVQGQHSQQTEQRFEWITGPDAFVALWQSAHLETTPEVDFERDGVIAVYMGEQPTGGHRIHVERVARQDDELQVEVVFQFPGPDCMTTQALTQPYQMVLVPRAAPRASFSTRSIIVPCR